MTDAVTERFFRWMEARNIKRNEAATLLGVDERSLSTYRSRGLPTKKIARAEALMQEDSFESRPLQNLVLEFSDAEFEKIGRAALKANRLIPEWAKEMLNSAADEDMEALARILRPSLSSIVSFPEIPLLRAAAGMPILADAEMVEPDRALGEGRFLLELRGDSMEPRFQDRQRVVMRDRATLKRPVLKYGEFYCFVHDGQACFKQWAKDAKGNKVLRSLNPDHADILATEETGWIGWLDPADNA